MLIKPISDLHAEFWPANNIRGIFDEVVPPASSDRDVVACFMGDNGQAHRHDWLQILSAAAARFRAVVCVAGNHFYYHSKIFGALHRFKASISLPKNVFFLENESVEIDGVVFIGATLWTDFDGCDPLKMLNVRREISDFKCIRKPDGSLLQPMDTVERFVQSRQYIFDAIAAAQGKKAVVLTHHGVSTLSVHDRYRGYSMNCAFVSDLSTEIINCGPDLWLHAHVHDSFDYEMGDRSRIIVNPYGYRGRETNPNFDPGLLVSV